MSQADRYFIGPGLRDKLRDVIRRSDSQAYGSGAKAIETRLQDMIRAMGGGSAIRLGEIMGSWVKGATKSVVRLNGDGTPVSPEETFQAKNYFADITVDCGTRRVMCAKVGDTWLLITAEC